MVNNWHDYRSDIGGKFQSWISNTLRQDSDIKEQLFGNDENNKCHLSELKKIKEAVPDWGQSVDNASTAKDFETDKKEIVDIVEQMINTLEDLQTYQQTEKRIPIAELQSYRDLLSSLSLIHISEPTRPY